jgi:hypothetical protein
MKKQELVLEQESVRTLTQYEQPSDLNFMGTQYPCPTTCSFGPPHQG